MRSTAIAYVQSDTFGGLSSEIEKIGGRLAKTAPTSPISVSHAVEVTEAGTLYTAIVIYEIDPLGVDFSGVFDR